PISVRDLAAGQERLSLFADDLKAEIHSFAADGSWLLVSDGQETLRLLATADGRELAAFPARLNNGSVDACGAVALPGARILAVNRPSPGPDEPGGLHLWDIAAARELARLPRVRVAPWWGPESPSFSRDG